MGRQNPLPECDPQRRVCYDVVLTLRCPVRTQRTDGGTLLPHDSGSLCWGWLRAQLAVRVHDPFWDRYDAVLLSGSTRSARGLERARLDLVAAIVYSGTWPRADAETPVKLLRAFFGPRWVSRDIIDLDDCMIEEATEFLHRMALEMRMRGPAPAQSTPADRGRRGPVDLRAEGATQSADRRPDRSNSGEPGASAEQAHPMRSRPPHSRRCRPATALLGSFGRAPLRQARSISIERCGRTAKCIVRAGAWRAFTAPAER